MSTDRSRRTALALTGLAVSTAFLSGARGHASDPQGEQVGAVEDLMREHGIIRRAILIYRQIAANIRAGEAPDAMVLERTAKLLRNFGEDYHERKLEEAHIFPAIRKAGGRAAGYIDALLEQHRRGREVTDYIIAFVSKGTVANHDSGQLLRPLDQFELMYEHHAAREDTIVFPAWKKTMNGQQLAEMGEKFEEIERQQFGKDGFENAEEQISALETEVGIANIARFTPASSPKI